MDGRGLPARLLLTPGQVSGKTTAPDLLGPLGLTSDAVGDRGYFGQAVIGAIEASGARAHIPSQSDVRTFRTVNRRLDRERNRIKRFFNRLKYFPGIVTRYFKTAANFLADLHLASARLWIRHRESTT